MELPSGKTRRLSVFAQRLASCGLAMTLQQILQTIQVRLAWYDSTVDPARPEYNEHCIFVVWHENLAILLPQWPHCPLTLLVSQHRDAHWLTHAADFLGFNVVRGSTTRGGTEAIRQLRRLQDRTSFAITPDGPRGPRREMALGPLFLASRLQMPLVPVGVGHDRPYRLRTWDQFAIPRPFSRARIVVGPKIRLARRLDRQALESCRHDTQRLLTELNDFAAAWAVSGDRVPGEQPFVRARRCLQLQFELGSRPDRSDNSMAAEGNAA